MEFDDLYLSAMCLLSPEQKGVLGTERSVASAACELEENCILLGQEIRSPGRRSWESYKYW